MAIQWRRNLATGEWHGSKGSGSLVIQHSRKSGRWYLMLEPFMGPRVVLGDYPSRAAAMAAAE